MQWITITRAWAGVVVLSAAMALGQVAGQAPLPGQLPGPTTPPINTSKPGGRLGPAASPASIPEVGSQVGEKIPAKYDVSKIGHRGIGSGLDFYSLEKEMALGKELARDVDAESKFVTDPVVTEYVNRLAQNIVHNSDAKVPFTVKVIESDDINAFALPGGFFYVNSGLILAADNEAELAGVMAHEIAHVAARHATKQATKAQLFDFASVPLIFIGGPAGVAAREVFSLAVPMTFLKFSRSAESEADLLGIEYAYASGYDPQAMVQFFEKLAAKDKKHHNFLAKAFSTHPMTADRVKRADDVIAHMLPARPEYVVTTSEFEDVKARLARIEGSHQLDSGPDTRPTLHRRSENTPDGGKQNPDDRPTLHRR